MPRVLLICRREWNDLNMENLHFYSLIHFLTQRLNIEIVVHEIYDSLAEQPVTHDAIGTILWYGRYFDQWQMDEIAQAINKHIDSEKPFTAIKNFLCSTPPPTNSVAYDPSEEPLPTWLQPYFDAQKPIDVASPYLELDVDRFPHYSQEMYQEALDRASKLYREEMDSAVRESKYDGAGLGPWVNTFLIEPDQLLSLINERHGSHQILHHSIQHLIRYHNEVLTINGIKPERYQFINGWLYKKTGVIETPVLELAASQEDWNSAEFGPALRRVVQWIYAQRQAIPVLSDLTVITPERI